MTAFVDIASFVVLLFVLVGVHELGHFSAAKLFGIRVEEFGFGFPPRVWGRRRGETLYSINAIPLGGFVRLAGENGDVQGPWSFAAKPAWQRSIVLAAGAVMNLLLAFVLFFLVYTVAPIPFDQPRVTSVQPHSPAAVALRRGDLITAVNGTGVTTQSDVQDQVACSAGRPTVLSIDREGRRIQVTVVPRVNPPPGQGRVGFWGTIAWTGTDGWSALRNTLGQPGVFVSNVAGLFAAHRCNPQDSGVTGPVGIARATGDATNAVTDLGAGPVLYLAAVVSMNLAFVNILPLPALDGGRLVFVWIGVARRRRINPKVEAIVHLVGFALLLLLVLIVSFHDISIWLGGK